MFMRMGTFPRCPSSLGVWWYGHTDTLSEAFLLLLFVLITYFLSLCNYLLHTCFSILKLNFCQGS